MVTNNIKYIFFVDDEPKIREVISQTLKMPGVEVLCFADAVKCLEQISCRRCDLLITDLKMPVMNGLELLKSVKSVAPWIPVLVVTGYGDIPSAVSAIKAGASDFMEKPLSKESLLLKVNMLLGGTRWQKSYLGKPLTLNEQKILKMITEGKSSKEIASILHRSLRTIEVHRSRIMDKFSADNLVELLKQAALMGIVELPKKQEFNGNIQESPDD
jgi:two-component system, LuxR family, response regulator FixJ